MKDKTDKEKELIAKVQPLSEDLHCSEEGKEQYKIGELYRRGWKVFKDENKAVDYYLHAINNGYSKAFESLILLAKKGNSKARFSIGEMYYNGCRVEKDILTAIKWYSMAAKHGHTEASYKIKQLAEEGCTEAIIVLRHLAEKDNTLASSFLKQLAEHGNAEAQYNYGVLFLKKKLVEEAKPWFFKAMLLGHSEAKDVYRSLISKNEVIL